MRKIFALTLVAGLMTSGVMAKPIQKKRTAPSSAVTANKVPKKASNSIYTDLIKVLPDSDLVGIIDGKRLFNDVMPALSAINNQKLNKEIGELREVATKIGIDLSKASITVFGRQISRGEKGSGGAFIVTGLNLDSQKLEAKLKSAELSLPVEQYKNNNIYFTDKEKQDVVTVLSGDRFVCGDYDFVKQVMDIDSGAKLQGVSPMISAALMETNSSALIRFAMNVPDDVKEKAASQDEMFASVSAIKYVRGTIDTAKDLSLSLDIFARTATAKDALDLVKTLNALIELGRTVMGMGNPKYAPLEPLLDQIKIASKTTDVTLSLIVPRNMIDQISKP